jgi:FtsZ-interacting cell division protein ZipA
MDNDTISLTKRVLPEWVDFLIVLGAILLVAMIVFFWAHSIRKRKNRIRKYRHHHHRKGIRERFQRSTGDIKELVQQNRSGRRREHRPINPTLAQTGGLPPLREADEQPPQAPQP